MCACVSCVCLCELCELCVLVQSDESAQLCVLKEELRRKEEVAHVYMKQFVYFTVCMPCQVSVELEHAQMSLSEALAAKQVPHDLLVAAVNESQILIRRVLESLDTSGNTCTADHLLTTSRSAVDSIDIAASAFSLYSKDPQSEPSLYNQYINIYIYAL